MAKRKPDTDRLKRGAAVHKEIQDNWKEHAEGHVCAEKGIIFPRRPTDPNRLSLIEQLFEEEGISVVWQDESVEECKARADQG